MKKNTAQEVKRKIDSKIFELQSALLAEDAGAVDEALLRECAAWFLPQHLQDIVIERSEAEGRCGWPGCGKKLPSWRLAAPLVFDLPEGEQLGRFCERSCMAKTNIFMSAIPPTHPYARENLVRLVLPPPASAAKPAGVSGGGSEGGGGEGAGAKKMYKRARRRDVPSPKEASAAAPGVAPKAGSGKNVGAEERVGEAEENGAEASATCVVLEQSVADAPVVGDGEAAVSGSVLVPDERRDEERERSKAPAAEASAVTDCSGSGSGVKHVNMTVNGGVGMDVEPRDADSTESVRAALDKVAISTNECAAASSTPPAAAAPVPPAPASAAGDVRAERTAVAVAARVPASSDNAWESVRFNRTSGSGGFSSSSVVSRHASLAVAAAETAAALAMTKAGSVRAGIVPYSEEPKAGNNGSTPGPVEEESPPTEPESSGSSKTGRKSVSFAEGTKESPQKDASAPLKLSARGKAAAAKRAAAAAAAGTRRGEGAQRGRRGGRGQGSGNPVSGAGRGRSTPPPPPKKSVLGGVVERAPAVPAPMEARVGGGGTARSKGAIVEGHLPKIEADLSFSVVPRGGFPGGRVGGDDSFALGGSEVVEGLGESELGVDRGPLVGDEAEDEEEAKEEGAEGDSEEDSETDADESDRAIWREAFGEDLPFEVASGSWIDMGAVQDKEMREEFVSSIAPFALLWSALSEWVTPETRAVCRASRAASAAAAGAAAVAVAAPWPPSGAVAESGANSPSSSVSWAVVPESSHTSTGKTAGIDTMSSGNNDSSALLDHSGFVPADYQARKAGAVAEAIEAEVSRLARRDGGRRKAGGKEATSNGGGATRSDGPTLTGALRHTGVSTMVNMHLAQAELALRAATATNTVGGGGSGDDSVRRGIHHMGRWNNDAEVRKKWIWSETAAKARKGARVPGGWVEEEKAMVAAAVPLKAPPARTVKAQEKETTTTDDVEITRCGSAAVLGTPSEEAPGEPGEPVTVGGAECRRAVATVIDTLDAGSASAAADLSIAQWKVVSLVLLTAIGLGAGAIIGGGGKDGGVEGAAVVRGEEADGGAAACARLCGPEASVSAREFRILVETMLQD